MPLRVETSPNQYTEYEIFSAKLINEFGRELFEFLNSPNQESKKPVTQENQTTNEENQTETEPNKTISVDSKKPVLKHPSDLCRPLHQQSPYYFVSKETWEKIQEQCSSHDSTFPYTPPVANQTTGTSTDNDEQTTTSILDWPNSKSNETGVPLRSQIVTIVQCRSNPTSGILGSDQNRSKSRHIVRLLVHLQNQQQRQMEAFLDLINEALLLEPDTIKTLWDSNGEQITDPIDLLRRGRLYFASSEDNINLDQLEIADNELASINRFEIVRQRLSQSAHFVSKPIRSDQTRTPSRKSTPFNMDERRSATVQAQAIAYNDPNTFPDVFLRHYEVGDIIGDGRFSAVFECRDRATGITLALKIIDKVRCQGFEYLIENELAILRRVKHPNIIKLVEEFQNEQKYFLIFEYVPGGDLFTAISTMNKYSEYDVALMVSQMAMALKHLHSLNIVHRDVKLDNVLMSTYPDQSVTLKLADFGLALCFTDQTPRQVAAQGESLCGTPMYMAPEVIEYGDYRIENDLWSLGIITFTLLSGMAPFNGENEQEILQNVTKTPIDYSLLPKVSADCRNALMAMLDRDPRNRISASDLLQHPWILNALERRKEAIKDAAHPRRRRKPATRQQPLLTFSSVENPHTLPVSNLGASMGDIDEL